MEYREHEVVWDDIRVKRFWNYMERAAVYESNYFTFHMAPGILRFLTMTEGLSGRAIDYGAGKGFLLNALLNKTKVKVIGVEFSEESVAALNLKFKDRERFGGCFEVGKISSALHGTCDWVFLVEILEHLNEQQTSETLLNISNLLKVGGKVVVTVPRSEDLERSKTLCPDCGAIFHLMQHQRSFEQSDLKTLMEEHGFRSLASEPINFDMYRSAGVYFRYRLSRIIKPWRVDFRPNLVYVGTKEAA